MIFMKRAKHLSNCLISIVFTMVSALVPINTSSGATSTSTFQVTATVASSCTVTATSLAFGNYTLAQLDGTSTITATCTNGTTYTIGLDVGTFSGATTSTRKMTGPSAAGLSYSLFSDSGRTTNWGNATGSWVSGTGTGAAQVLTVYGRIPANQTALIGSYTVIVTVTVTY
jgi:spore coat protein U-like protein